MKKRKTSLIGELIVIILISVFVYLAYVVITPNPFMQVEEIYKEYNVSENNLIPNNSLEYITALKAIDNQVTAPIIDFVYLDVEEQKLQRNINQFLFLDCIPNDLYRKFETFIAEKNSALRNFKDTRTIRHEKIFWEQYIDILEHKNVENVFERIKLLERC